MSDQPDSDIYLCCAPATALCTARGSVFHHRCSVCTRHVAMAPTGQRFIKKHPAATIICMYCYYKQNPEEFGEHILAASAQEISNEMQTGEPNLWRKRN